MQKTIFKQQFIPLILTLVVFAVLAIVIYGIVLLLNMITPSCTTFGSCIKPEIRLQDVLIGLTIYLKTSVDFAIFIGNLMSAYPSVRGRIAIEVGTAAGNAAGTIIVLVIWDFFREIPLLLGTMVFIAALVLFKLAEEGLEHTHEGSYKLPNWFYTLTDKMETVLYRFNKISGHLLDRIMPNISMRPKTGLTFWGLFAMSFSIPFILGLDDFAGYVPVFNLVNVFGFSIGVLLGHMILNLLLFINPQKTITAVKNPIISFLGTIAFIALGIWGLIEAVKIFTGIH